jgi:hypothetical protein
MAGISDRLPVRSGIPTRSRCCEKIKCSRRCAQMHADNYFCFNLRSFAFICGFDCFSTFRGERLLEGLDFWRATQTLRASAVLRVSAVKGV